MEHVLESHLALLEREVDTRPPTSAEHGALLDDLVVLHAALYEALESHLSPGGVTEDDRPMVPLFQRWLRTARQIVAAARSSKANGRPVARVDELVRAINRSKPVAEDFDHFVELNRRTAAGDAGTYRPLTEVTDELPNLDRLLATEPSWNPEIDSILLADLANGRKAELTFLKHALLAYEAR